MPRQVDRHEIEEIVRVIERSPGGATIEQIEQAVGASRRTIRDPAQPIVVPEDLEEFVAMGISELSGLHEGNIARYRLRLSEFRRWRGRRR